MKNILHRPTESRAKSNKTFYDKMEFDSCVKIYELIILWLHPWVSDSYSFKSIFLLFFTTRKFYYFRSWIE